MVYADIGLTKDRRINWRSPLITRMGIHGIPHYILLDAAGNELESGSGLLSSMSAER